MKTFNAIVLIKFFSDNVASVGVIVYCPYRTSSTEVWESYIFLGHNAHQELVRGPLYSTPFYIPTGCRTTPCLCKPCHLVTIFTRNDASVNVEEVALFVTLASTVHRSGLPCNLRHCFVMVPAPCLLSHCVTNKPPSSVMLIHVLPAVIKYGSATGPCTIHMAT